MTLRPPASDVANPAQPTAGRPEPTDPWTTSLRSTGDVIERTNTGSVLAASEACDLRARFNPQREV